MSYIFEAGDTTVWSPALRIGDLYVQLAESLADWQGRPSGLSKLADDYYVVDVDTFADFIRLLLADPGAGHRIFAELTQGFIAISLVMLDRAGSPVPSTPDLAALTGAVAATMPR